MCFRRRVDEARNAALVAELEATGEAFVSSTRLHGEYAIRLCVLNHTSRAEDVEWVLDWFARADVPPPARPRQLRAESMSDVHALGPFPPWAVRALPLFAELTDDAGRAALRPRARAAWSRPARRSSGAISSSATST